MLITKLTQVIDSIDPYGHRRVNALQILFVIICLFFMNLFFSPPYFQQLIMIFMGAFLCTAEIINYNQRQIYVGVFCLLTIICAILINLVKEYNYASVLMVGFMLSSLYLAAKKFPQLFIMIIMLYMFSVAVVQIKVGGSYYVYINYILLLSVYTLVDIAFMNLFPRIYYFRVWLRAYCLSLQEIEQSIHNLVTNSGTTQTNHLIAMNKYTLSLNYKDHGFSARKTNILLLDLHNFLIVYKQNTTVAKPLELMQIAAICADIRKSIAHHSPIDLTTIQFINLPNNIANSLQQLIYIWNKLCLKT